MDILRHAIAHVAGGQDLTEDEAYWVMTAIMNGEATPAQIGGYLVGLAAKGEGVAEIAGSARAMREHAVPVHHHADGKLVDTCGTGGDYGGTFNISTTAAFVVAGAGLGVAKHGNRSVSSQSGSADVLQALGLNLDLEPERVADSIDSIGFGFLFAPKLHPAMRHAIGPRREMGIRTVFNLLGPLCNPAGARTQVIGVYSHAMTQPLADVLKSLGSRAAYVVHGADGLDELSTTGVNQVAYFDEDGDMVIMGTLDGADFGLARAHLSDLKGGTAEENAALTRAVLDGERGPRRDVVLLNAAAALVAAGRAASLREGIPAAAAVIDSGAARQTLDRAVEFSRDHAAS